MPKTTSKTDPVAVHVEPSITTEMRQEVRYAIDNGLEYARSVGLKLGRELEPAPDLSDLAFLEIGCGKNFGPMLICRALGATVAVAGDWLEPWNDAFHPDFYRALAVMGPEEIPTGNWAFLTDLLDAGQHPDSILRVNVVNFHDRSSLPYDDHAFDCVVSNGLLNRTPADFLIGELARITKPNGFGIHQIDMRDSQEYSRPLDYLLMPDDEFDAYCRETNFRRGNRLRPCEFTHLFRLGIFRVEHFGPNMQIEEDYFNEILPKLPERYQGMKRDDLTAISGRFYLRHLTDDVVREEVEYSLHIALEYADLIATEMNRAKTPAPDLSGLSILELGPGLNFGTALILNGLGAHTAVLDKYLAEWDVGYHVRFYPFLRERAEQEIPSGHWSALDRIIETQSHPTGIIPQDDTDLAHPPSRFADGSFDVIVSNAVLEHVGDVPQTAAEMGRLTRPGGINIHQVDFRDHRGFSRPLEFLTMPDGEYQHLFDTTNNGNGNRVRLHVMADDFREAGFDVTRTAPNIWAERKHFEDVRPRLQPQFAAMSDEDLLVVSGRLFLKRSGGPQTNAPTDDKETDNRWAVAGDLHEHVEYAILNGLHYARLIGEYFGRPLQPLPDEYIPTPQTAAAPDLTGLSILELGPGPAFGTMLICKALGAQISILDKYLASWDEAYHPRFYALLRRVAAERIPHGNWSVLDELLAANRHDPHLIGQDHSDLAGPDCHFPAHSFDAIVSNAVLEHVGSTDVMAIEMARLTKPGGLNIHQVDFRDHRNFDLPLEFLTVPDQEYQQVFDSTDNANGNRVRGHELVEDFKRAGFTIRTYTPNLWASPEHLAEVRPRLLAHFQSMTDDQLLVVSAQLILVHETQSEEADPIKTEEPTIVEFCERTNDQIRYSIQNAIDFAYNIGRHFGRTKDFVPDFSKTEIFNDAPDLTGLSILELGPGRNFACMFLCQGLGADVAVFDKYLAPWEDDYHPRFYEALRNAVARSIPHGRWDGLDAILRAGSHLSDVIPMYDGDLAMPPSALPEAAFDAVASNAVLEHVGDSYASAVELARITRPGGVGLHQIDYRDHLDFEHPFEFLKCGDDEYQAIFDRLQNTNGNRVRNHEWEDDFQRAGFEVRDTHINCLADPDELACVRPLLAPRFAPMSDEQLLAMSARITVCRTETPAPPSPRKENTGLVHRPLNRAHG